MTTLHHFQSTNSMHGLIETIDRFYDAGIDPAFDSDMEELERQFSELRFSVNHN